MGTARGEIFLLNLDTKKEKCMHTYEERSQYPVPINLIIIAKKTSLWFKQGKKLVILSGNHQMRDLEMSSRRGLRQRT